MTIRRTICTRVNLKRLLAVSAVAAMFSTVGVQAQTTSAAQTNAAGGAQPDARLSSGDEKALKDMAQANINEVAAAARPRQGPDQ